MGERDEDDGMCCEDCGCDLYLYDQHEWPDDCRLCWGCLHRRYEAARTPGPATAMMVKHVEALKDEPAGGAVFIAVAQNIQDDAEAFIAELEPAKPEESPP